MSYILRAEDGTFYAGIKDQQVVHTKNVIRAVQMRYSDAEMCRKMLRNLCGLRFELVPPASLGSVSLELLAENIEKLYTPAKEAWDEYGYGQIEKWQGVTETLEKLADNIKQTLPEAQRTAFEQLAFPKGRQC